MAQAQHSYLVGLSHGGAYFRDIPSSTSYIFPVLEQLSGLCESVHIHCLSEPLKSYYQSILFCDIRTKTACHWSKSAS